MLLSYLPQTPKFPSECAKNLERAVLVRDRGVIGPPPLLEMCVDAPNASPEELQMLEAAKMRLPYAIVHCKLWNSSDNSDAMQRCQLMGTVIAHSFVGKDENGVKECFFCFPDCACQSAWPLQLKVLFGDFGSIRDEAGLFDTRAEHGREQDFYRAPIQRP
jgi:hypothetical protein